MVGDHRPLVPALVMEPEKQFFLLLSQLITHYARTQVVLVPNDLNQRLPLPALFLISAHDLIGILHDSCDFAPFLNFLVFAEVFEQLVLFRSPWPSFGHSMIGF